MARVRVVTARWSDHLRALYLQRDEEAQYWQGWSPEEAMSGLPALPGVDPLLITPDLMSFIAVHTRTGRMVASIVVTRQPDSSYGVGGTVDPEFRGQGYGREALEAVCLMAHHHFGFGRLVAACEVANIASQRWLAACGFTRVDGPSQHTLPNGRVIESLWWRRADHTAKRRCRGLSWI